MKGKGSGWKGESRRHSLARKGVKTANGRFKIEYDYDTLVELKRHMKNNCKNVKSLFLSPLDSDSTLIIADEIHLKEPIKIKKHITNKFDLQEEYGNLPHNEFDDKLMIIQDEEMNNALRDQFSHGNDFNLMVVEFDIAYNYFTVYSIYGEFRENEVRDFIEMVNRVGGYES